VAHAETAAGYRLLDCTQPPRPTCWSRHNMEKPPYDPAKGLRRAEYSDDHGHQSTTIVGIQSVPRRAHSWELIRLCQGQSGQALAYGCGNGHEGPNLCRRERSRQSQAARIVHRSQPRASARRGPDRARANHVAARPRSRRSHRSARRASCRCIRRPAQELLPKFNPQIEAGLPGHLLRKPLRDLRTSRQAAGPDPRTGLECRPPAGAGGGATVPETTCSRSASKPAPVSVPSTARRPR